VKSSEGAPGGAGAGTAGGARKVVVVALERLPLLQPPSTVGVSLLFFSVPDSVAEETSLAAAAPSAEEEKKEESDGALSGGISEELLEGLDLAALAAFSRASTESRVAAFALAGFEVGDVDASNAAPAPVPATEEGEDSGAAFEEAAGPLPSGPSADVLLAAAAAAARALAEATCFAMRFCTRCDAAGPRSLHPKRAVSTARSAISALADEYASLLVAVVALEASPLLLSTGLLSLSGSVRPTAFSVGLKALAHGKLSTNDGFFIIGPPT